MALDFQHGFGFLISHLRRTSRLLHNVGPARYRRLCIENLAIVADTGCRYQRLCRKVIAVNQGVVFIGGGERVALPFVIGVVLLLRPKAVITGVSVGDVLKILSIKSSRTPVRSYLSYRFSCVIDRLFILPSYSFP